MVCTRLANVCDFNPNRCILCNRSTSQCACWKQGPSYFERSLNTMGKITKRDLTKMIPTMNS